MLAADLPVDLLTGPDDPVAQVTHVETVAPTDQPIRAPSGPTATDIDALFEADFDPQPGVLVEPGDPLDTRAADHHFAEVEQLVPDDQQPLARDSQPGNLANSVANFQWPATGLTAKVATEPAPQQPPDQSAAGSSTLDRSANPIRGPPTATGAQNSLIDRVFLESGPSDPELTGPAAPRQLVVVDPQLDDIDVLASGISGPGIDLVTLRADSDPLAQIEAALGHSGQVSAVHIFSHATAGQFTLSGLAIDQELVSARADAVARWSENLTDDATLFLYGCNLAETVAGRSLVDRMAELTGATVAASTDLTGSPLLGGNWQLEYQAGDSPATGSLVIPTYRSLLPENNAPIFTSDPVATVTEGNLYTYNITTSDLDGDGVTVTAPTLPGWLKLTKSPFSSFSTNEGSLSSDGVLTLLDEEYADIPASTMGNWGTDSFEVSVKIKSADGSGNVTSGGTGSGMLFIRSSQGPSPYTGPTVFLKNNGYIGFRLRGDDALTLPTGTVSSWADWVALRFVYDATANKLQVFVNGEEKGSRTLTETVDSSHITGAPLRFGANHVNTSSQNLNAQIKDLVISGFGEAGTDSTTPPFPSFSTNTGNLSSDGVLTLLDDQYADIPASTMGDWGTESFELSVSIKSADNSENITAATNTGSGSGTLFVRSSSSIGYYSLPPDYTSNQDNSTSSYDGPGVFLRDSGYVNFRIRSDINLTVDNAVDSWSDWVNLKFVLDADSSTKTLKIFVDDVEKGSLNIDEGNWNKYIANKGTFTSMWMRLGAHWKPSHTIYQNLNVQIKDLVISGVFTNDLRHLYKFTNTGKLTGTPTSDDVGKHPVILNATDPHGLTSQEFTITVAGANSAPINTVPGPQTVDEDIALAITGLSVQYSTGNLATTQLSVTNGTLTVSLAGGATINAGTNASSTLTLGGTQTQINAALATVSYQGNLNYHGDDTLTIVSSDSTGTPLTDTDTVDITVTAVDDPPTANAGDDFDATGQIPFDLTTTGLLITDVDGTPTNPAPESEPWATEISPTSQRLSGVTFGNSTFVAVGEYGTILSSSDGTTWVLQWDPQTSHTFNPLYGVTFGNSTFVAVGDEGTILTSWNGPTWVPQWDPQTSHTFNPLYGVTFGNSTFVAVGDGGTILTSSDGTTWATEISPTSQHLYGVTFGNSTFVAVGEYGTILTSSDGTTWVPQLSDTYPPLSGVTFGNSTFVAVGKYGTILTSSDGTTWATETSHTFNPLYGVTFGNSTFVAVGDEGTILTLLDGPTWVPQWVPQTPDTYRSLWGVTFGNNTFVAVGDGGTILTSWAPPASEPEPETPVTLSAHSSDAEINVGVGSTGIDITSGNGTNSVEFTGTIQQINDLFAGNADATLTYTINTDNPPASDTLTLTVGEGASSSSDTAAITFTAVADAPVNTVPGPQTVAEDTALAITGLSVNDPDGNLATTQLTVTNGTLTVSLTGGATISAGTNASSTLTLSGTQTQINAALATVSYQGNLNVNGSDTLTIVSSDSTGTPLTDTDTVDITVTAVADPPINTVPGPQTVDEDTALAISDLSVNDVDGDLATTQLTVTNGTLTVSLAGGATISAGTNASSTLTLSGTQDAINAALATVSYQGNLNFNGDVIQDYDYLTIVSSDSSGTPLTDTDTVEITVTAVADAPVNTVPGPQTVAEDTALAITGLSVNDPDGDLATTQLSVINGTLTVSLAAGATISAGTNSSSTLTLSGTQDAINATLATVSYQGNLNVNGDDTLTIVSSDSTGTPLTDSDTVTITVTAVADPPINTVPGPQTVAEDTALAITGLSVNDPDGDLATTQLSVTNGTLTVSLAGGATISAGTNASSTLTLSGTQDAINAALATVSYQGNLNFNGDVIQDYDYLTIVSSDSTGTPLTDTDTVEITVTAVDDPPVNTVPGPQTVAEDTALAITGLSVNDPDGDLATTQLSVINGTLTVSLAAGATISAGTNSSSTLTLSGTQDAINAALATVSYQGNLYYNGDDTLTIVSSDSTGTPLTDTDTVDITGHRGG